ncbi:hypothetical protein L7F22_033533 [Adiantum nelumboides]|nr:hypothetical protein [Adiantum nelumboides]
MGSPSSARRRYPSPLIKQDLAKLGKDADSRRSALASLRSVVEEHLDTTSLPRFLQQIEDSREGRRHVAPVLEDLARTHGPSLAPHIPRLLHLLVHNLLASAGSPALLGACAEAVAGIARHCAGNTAEEVLRQVCLPLLALLPNKIPPLSTGAAVCLRSLVDSEQWRFAPPSLVDDLCWKAAMAAAAPPTQTVPHIHLLRALATSNASAISKFAPPLLRLSLDILLTPAATASWQLRLSAVHLLESLLKAADYTALAAHLHPSLAALAKCRRHDKLPQVRNAVLQALQTAEALQRQQTKHSVKAELSTANHYRQLSDPFTSNMQNTLPSQISHSPLSSPRRLNSLSARVPTNGNSLDQSEYLLPYFCNPEEIAPSREVFLSTQESVLPNSSKCTRQKISTRNPSPNRQVKVPSLKLPIGQGRQHGKESVGKNGNAEDSCLHSARDDLRSLPAPNHCEVLAMSSSATRNITVLGSNDELLASCERHFLASDNCDVSCQNKTSLTGQFAEAKYAGENSKLVYPAPTKKNQAVNTESKQHNAPSIMLDSECDTSAASLDKCEDSKNAAKEGTAMLAADIPEHSENENITSTCPLTDPEKLKAQRSNPTEAVDIEAETSSSEWSVRDNPIAEDQAEDMVKHNNDSWPRISTTLHEEINKQWNQSGIESDSILQAETEQRCKQETCNGVPLDVGKSAHFQDKQSQLSFVAEEFWTEIEDLRDQTASSQSIAKAEPRKSFQFQNRLQFKLLLCAGLLVSITMTLLSKELQQHATAQYLPPT